MAEKPTDNEPSKDLEMAKNERKFKVDRVWIIDKGIELSIFVLGFLIALYIDDVRDANDVKKLKEHYIHMVRSDLEKDMKTYENAYKHDSLRSEGCEYILSYLLKRQNSEYHSFGRLKHDSKGHIGPGFDFDETGAFDEGDTILIVNEEKGWYLDTSGYWINARIVKIFDNSFNWFSQEINDSVKGKIEFYQDYLDVTKSVFQHTTGYKGLISQNTSKFLNSIRIETELSDYYQYGTYVNWLEDFYRESHFHKYNDLRYSFGDVSFFEFLYKLNKEQNNDLIRQLTIAKIHAKKEMGYYVNAMKMNRNIQQLIKDKKF